MLAARNPSAHRSLIAYAIWSGFAHTAVMALMAIQLPTKRGELLAGVAVTGLLALLLFVFARSAARTEGVVPGYVRGEDTCGCSTGGHLPRTRGADRTRSHGTLTGIGPLADLDARGPGYLPPQLSNEAVHARVFSHLD